MKLTYDKLLINDVVVNYSPGIHHESQIHEKKLDSTNEQ